MTYEDLVRHLEAIGYTVEQVTGQDGQSYLVIRSYRITVGSLAGQTCDVAIQRMPAVPFVLPPAIQTRPALIPMGSRNTQASGVGSEWQYWSRVLRVPPTPEAIVTHIATIFGEV